MMYPAMFLKIASVIPGILSRSFLELKSLFEPLLTSSLIMLSGSVGSKWSASSSASLMGMPSWSSISESMRDTVSERRSNDTYGCNG